MRMIQSSSRLRSWDALLALALAIALMERLRCFLRCREPEDGEARPGTRTGTLVLGGSFGRLGKCSFGRLVLMKCWCSFPCSFWEARSRAGAGARSARLLLALVPMLVLGGPCCHASLLASFPFNPALWFLGVRVHVRVHSRLPLLLNLPSTESLPIWFFGFMGVRVVRLHVIACIRARLGGCEDAHKGEVEDAQLRGSGRRGRRDAKTLGCRNAPKEGAMCGDASAEEGAMQRCIDAYEPVHFPLLALALALALRLAMSPAMYSRALAFPVWFCSLVFFGFMRVRVRLSFVSASAGTPGRGARGAGDARRGGVEEGRRGGDAYEAETRRMRMIQSIPTPRPCTRGTRAMCTCVLVAYVECVRRVLRWLLRWLPGGIHGDGVEDGAEEEGDGDGDGDWDGDGDGGGEMQMLVLGGSFEAVRAGAGAGEVLLLLSWSARSHARRARAPDMTVFIVKNYPLITVYMLRWTSTCI
ncbi:hypothetical protein B0H13DRAFT_2406497 [Mycena leptocephala]|nr:hypothetical protein B0H13DRAFT_2406497 [Mycena leptocephala]